MESLRDDGRSTFRNLYDLHEWEPRVGAGTRTDGTPFYMTTYAPDGDRLDTPWEGAFYAPCGGMTIIGSVNFTDGPRDGTGMISVSAKLTAGADTLVDVAWTVIGPKSSVTSMNRAALIGTVTINNAGPHQAAAIETCIRRHAPERALAPPHELVALQCGVAASCLIEAIC